MNKNIYRIALSGLALAGSIWSSNMLAANVGYYEMCFGAGQPWHVSPIAAAGHTPIIINDLSSTELASLDVLFVTNCNNGPAGPEYLTHLGDIESRVNNGMTLIIHDRYPTNAATILPSGIGFVSYAYQGNMSNIDIIDGTTLVTTGPGGTIDNVTLDGGCSSNHGYLDAASLPSNPEAKQILSNGNPAQVVTFTYPFGQGHVIYSTIPLDAYLAGLNCGPNGGLQVPMTHYAANVIAYGSNLINLTPTANAGPDQSVNEGELVQLSGIGSDPQGEAITYAWTQLAGTPVTLSDPTAANPTFTAPYVAANETLTFQLVVTDASDHASQPDTVNIGVQQSNNPPIADAGADGTIKEGATKSLDGSASYDPDAGDAVTGYEWAQTAGTSVSLLNPSAVNPSFLAPLGTAGQVLTFELKVTDGKETSIADAVNVTVVANSAPVADAGPAQTKDENTVVSLNGSASTDPDGDGITYEWTQIGTPAVTLANADTASPSFTAPWVGVGGAALTFELKVTDNDPVNPKFHTDQVVVNVVNTNDPPSCDLAQPSVVTLWPPNHTLLPVSINGVADPNANFELAITSVTQDEPTNGLGDGDTSPDAVIQDGAPTDTVLLRAERSGKGDGRVYQVNFTATDAEGSCTGSVKVTAPHDRKRTAVDSGQAVDSTQP